MAIYTATYDSQTTPSIFQKERVLYGSSRLGTEEMKGAMEFVDLKNDLRHYVDFSNVTVITGTPPNHDPGTWSPYDVAGGPLYFPFTITDHDYDGDDDFVLETMAVPPYPSLYGSLWTYFNTIPGESYSFNYSIIDNSAEIIVANVYGSSGVSLASNNCTSVNTYVMTFSATSFVSRVKYFATDTSPGTASEYVVSDVWIEGPGDVLALGTPVPEPYYATNIIGDKLYEVSNHLGNVLNVIKDRKLPTEGTGAALGTINYFTADVVSYSDYYPYGMVMPNRNGSTSDYRYGFNGMEKDDEIKDNNNSYDFGARLYDPRVGRWLSTDPKANDYPDVSPYIFAGNYPIIATDPNGEEIIITTNSGESIKYTAGMEIPSDASVYAQDVIMGLNYVYSNVPETNKKLDFLIGDESGKIQIKETTSWGAVNNTEQTNSIYLESAIIVNFNSMQSDNFSNGSQSPIVGLIHELDHAHQLAFSMEQVDIATEKYYAAIEAGEPESVIKRLESEKNAADEVYSDYYARDKEELRATRGMETDVARFLNQAVRSEYVTPNSVSAAPCIVCTGSETNERAEEYKEEIEQANKVLEKSHELKNEQND